MQVTLTREYFVHVEKYALPIKDCQIKPKHGYPWPLNFYRSTHTKQCMRWGSWGRQSTTGEGYFGPTLKQSPMEISTFIKGGMGDWDHKWLQPGQGANEEDNVIDLGYLSPLTPNRINKCMIYLLKYKIYTILNISSIFWFSMLRTKILPLM